MVRTLVIAVVILSMALNVTGNSLVGTARRERERREALKKRAEVLTNKTIPRGAGSGRGALSVAGPEVVSESRTMAAAGVMRGAADWTEGVGEEIAWPKRIEEARQKIEDAEGDLEWAKSKLLILRLGLVYASDGASEFNRKVEVDSALAATDAARRAVDAARKELKQLKEEARRAGVPATLRRYSGRTEHQRET